MGRNAFLLEPLHQQIAHVVVDDTLALNGALFQTVESSSIVLVIDDQQFGIIRAEYLLGLSFIKLFTLDHACALLRDFLREHYTAQGNNVKGSDGSFFVS